MFFNKNFTISGTSSPTGKFFGVCAALASHEDSSTWTTIYKFMHDESILPSYHLGDGAKAITNAGSAVYLGEISSTRLMCYAHVHRNVLSHLKCVSTHNKTVADSILRDFENLQWSALNEASFRKCFVLLEEKYLI